MHNRKGMYVEKETIFLDRFDSCFRLHNTPAWKLIPLSFHRENKEQTGWWSVFGDQWSQWTQQPSKIPPSVEFSSLSCKVSSGHSPP